MLRTLLKLSSENNVLRGFTYTRTFLTNDYRCTEAWNFQKSPIFEKVNLNDFYNMLDQKYSSQNIISAVDVDVFANAIKDPTYLEELKDLLNKLRLSAETRNTLESTHHATIRHYLEFGNIAELIDILKDPLNFGIFLDYYSANILLDKLLTLKNYKEAADIASLIMLQEEYSNEITRALCQYACYKYIATYVPPESSPPEVQNNKIEEIKIRVKFLRNPYFDDHFDLKDTYVLSGKTLAWISETETGNLSNNLQIVGWMVYKKYDKLLNLCQNINVDSVHISDEVINLLEEESKKAKIEEKVILEKCIALLTEKLAKMSLEEALKIKIENAINKTQKKDISDQKQLFESWVKIRESKLEEQTKRLDRAKRIQQIEEKQNNLKDEEQKLWFFENEESIDLEIEEKEKLETDSNRQIDTSKESDENYIPPEILPKRK